MRKSQKNNVPLVDRGTLFFNEGKHHLAQICFAEAVLSDSANGKYKALFIQSVLLVPCPHHNKHIEGALSLCLDDPEVRHLTLFPVWRVMVMHSPARSFLTELQTCEDYDSFLVAVQNQDFMALINNPFFCQGLTKLLMKDYNLERVLTYFRRYFLCDASPNALKDAAPFLTALSLQCFLNEYLFYVSPEEDEALSKLGVAIYKNPLNVVLYACYKPLYLSQKVHDLKSILDDLDISGVQDLIRVQILEPDEESSLQAHIESFGSIENNVSRAVQAQYEEHPFPRWVACGSARAEERTAMSVDKNILIAGCGTGQQAIVAALNFPHAQITAIDLSRTSLGYAKRKAQAYALDNLTFMHGDILEVSALNQEFDYITCGGVLHHMQDPQAGLDALNHVLKPDGVMRIALYSELARRDIVRVQNLIQAQNIASTDEGIRNFRASFIDGGYKALFDESLPYFDCFSISETRDLFFHVQEHRFTCLGLKALLENLSLRLLVFAPNETNMHQGYQTLFPDDRAATALENWDVIEQSHPDLFLGMYKMYICREGKNHPGEIPEWLRI